MRPQARFRAQAEDRVLQRRTTLKDEEPFNAKLQEWENYYNYHRPTAPSADKHPMKDCATEPPRRHGSTAAAQMPESVESG